LKFLHKSANPKSTSPKKLRIHGIGKLQRTCNWNTLDVFIALHNEAEIVEEWRRLTAPYRDVAFLEKLMGEATLFVPDQAMDQQDADEMKADGILREIRRSEVKAFAKSFFVEELHKDRRRWILHPLVFNEITKGFYTSQTLKNLFPKVEEVIKKVTFSRSALLFDFSWYFGHFVIEEACAAYFAVVAGEAGKERFYVPAGVPTGAREPPLFAQILTYTIAKVAASAAESSAVTFDVMIDNVRFCGMSQDLRLVRCSFQKVCNDLCISINDIDESVPKSQYTFLGIVFDHNNFTVALAQKTIEKLSAFDVAADLTWQETLSIFGVCVFASRIVDKAAACFRYPVYKFIRRRARAMFDLTEAAKIWPCVVGCWSRWISALATAPPRCVLSSSNTAVLVTDSSKTGWAAYLFTDFETIVVAGPWSPRDMRQHINLLELRAVRRALETIFQSYLADCALDVVVDNTTAMHQLQSYTTPIYAANEELKKIVLACVAVRCSLESIRWIESAKNPADWWSRLNWPTWRHGPIHLMYNSPSCALHMGQEQHGVEKQGQGQNILPCVPTSRVSIPQNWKELL
jgi:hypothetical protein